VIIGVYLYQYITEGEGKMNGLRLGIKKTGFPATIEGWAIEGCGEKQALTPELLADLRKKYTKNQIILCWLNDNANPIEAA